MSQRAINRPFYGSSVKCTQFTGSNIAALQVDFPSTVFTDNGDGTWDVNGAYTLHVTDWVVFNSTVMDNATFVSIWQLANSGDKYVYDTQLTPYVNPQRRETVVPIPALTLLSPKTTLTCTFATAMPDTNYSVQIEFEGEASLVGSLNPPMVVTGSKTTAGFQFAVSALLAITLGTLSARCTVIATP